MVATANDDVNKLLNDLLARIQSVLHSKLLGLYLYGSLASGGFNLDVSDIDLLAIIDTDLKEQELLALKETHATIASQYPAWKYRIEVAYLSATGLREFKNKRSKIAVISPGEPLHVKDAGIDWLINWYSVQEKGIAFFGPNQTTFIPNISIDEYRNANKQQATLWLERINDYNDSSAPGSLAYVVFTMCRILYGYTKSEQTSKKQAGLWVTNEFPEWALLIEEATAWRKAQWDDVKTKDGTAISRVREFVNFVTGQILA